VVLESIQSNEKWRIQAQGLYVLIWIKWYAFISPIFKKGKKTDASNYRPISLTGIVCKLIESIIIDQIVQFFVVNNLFSSK